MIKRLAQPGSARDQRGASLIEVLVTVLIVTVGLLGLMGLQSNSLRMNLNAQQRSSATILTADMLNRIRTNDTQAFAGGAYETDYADSHNDPNCATCSTAQVAQYDLFVWKRAIDAHFPEGAGQIEITDVLVGASTLHRVLVSIKWAEDRYGGETVLQVETVL